MRLPAAVPIFSLLMLLQPADAQELGDVKAGLAYAEQVCSGCHAVQPDEKWSPVAEATSFKDVANTPGMTGTALSVWLQTSHPTMPNIVVEQQDMDDVIAYILSLKDRG